MNSKLFTQFCQDRNIKESTVKGYRSAIGKYTDFQCMGIDDLIGEAVGEENLNIPLKSRKIKYRLMDFRNHLLESDLSSNSIKTYFTKILTFYTHFEIELPQLPQFKIDKPYIASYNDLPTKEHIRQALEISSLDMKAVILFMASSGTAKAETLSLTVQDFIDATAEYHSDKNILETLEKRNDIIPTFYLKRLKTDKYYYTFCSPEATEMIIKYLKTRNSLKMQDKLFDFTSASLTNKFRQINDSLNWGFKGQYRFFRSHTLRKFHASNINLAGEYVDALQGRSKNRVHEAYIKTNPVKLKEIYKSAVSNVEIMYKKEENISQEFNITINVFLSGSEYNII